MSKTERPAVLMEFGGNIFVEVQGECVMVVLTSGDGERHAFQMLTPEKAEAVTGR